MWGKKENSQPENETTTVTITYRSGRVETITTSNPAVIADTERQAFSDPHVTSVHSRIH